MEPKAKAMFILCLLVPVFFLRPSTANRAVGEASNSPCPSPPRARHGGSVDIDVILYNSQQSDAFNVQIAFYKENIASSNCLFLDEVTIPAESTHRQHVVGRPKGYKVWLNFSRRRY